MSNASRDLFLQNVYDKIAEAASTEESSPSFSGFLKYVAEQSPEKVVGRVRDFWSDPYQVKAGAKDVEDLARSAYRKGRSAASWLNRKAGDIAVNLDNNLPLGRINTRTKEYWTGPEGEAFWDAVNRRAGNLAVNLDNRFKGWYQRSARPYVNAAKSWMRRNTIDAVSDNIDAITRTFRGAAETNEDRAAKKG